MFNTYTSKISNHTFRSEYATNLYKELTGQKENLQNNYREYDSAILKEISETLGHSRINVVVDNYLREDD